MNKQCLSERDASQSLTPGSHLDGRSGYLMREEEYILQSISIRAPLQDVLNGICSALDCQIGGVISFISLPWDDECELSEIVRNAVDFGLSTFCTQFILSEANVQLGSLEMYSCDRGSPSAREFQLIERAICLAAIAIQFECETNRWSDFRAPNSTTLPRNLFPESDFVN